MLIRLLQSRVVALPDGDRSVAQNRGDEIEVEDAEAIRMIEADQAVPVRKSRKETAVLSDPVEMAAVAGVGTEAVVGDPAPEAGPEAGAV